MGNSLFSAGFLKLEAAASARERMQTVHAGNIANADTPNFKADRRTFADFLAAKQTESGLTSTNASHMDSMSGSSLKKSVSTVQRMDGNTVDIQQEMANLAENQMMHELSLKLLKGRISGLANVIKEGGR
ncbi:MAG: flagellar basal body rod protein FlgB [Mariprofundaceae bacterium]